MYVRRYVYAKHQKPGGEYVLFYIWYNQHNHFQYRCINTVISFCHGILLLCSYYRHDCRYETVKSNWLILRGTHLHYGSVLSCRFHYLSHLISSYWGIHRQGVCDAVEVLLTVFQEHNLFQTTGIFSFQVMLWRNILFLHFRGVGSSCIRKYTRDWR